MNGKVVARPTLVDALMKANGEEIRSAREAMGISQTELATRSGANQQTIDKIERGLTRHSKFVPEIRRELGLPMVPSDIAESMLRFADLYGEREERIGLRARIAGSFGSAEQMPVFALERDGEIYLISEEPALYLPRSYPVEKVATAYGVIVPDDAMLPVMKQGEIAVVDPDQAPRWGSEVLLVRALADGRNAGILRTWIGFEDQASPNTRVRRWNPIKEETLNHYFWPAMGSVVAKLPPPPKK